MKTIGIIAEYNPFHNGHIYHINKIKELYPDSLIILIMSGYFTMRGEVSLLSKEDKTAIALQNHIDLVIELPIVFSSNSADIFAYSSIELLTVLKCDYIIFGSESDDIDKLKKIAEKQLDENEKTSEKIKDELKKGLSYPEALSNSFDEFVSDPNDILGVAYIKAIIKQKSTIVPISIKRTNKYHDLNSTERIISASNIRKKINDNISISNYLPFEALTKINKIDYNLLFNLLKYKINTDKDLSKYLTVDEGIEARLISFVNESSSMDDFFKKIKTKRYTYNRIQRMFLHILLGFTKEDKFKLANIEYIRILGFNSTGKNYLNRIKKDITLPFGTKVLGESLSRKYELKASVIYDIITRSNSLNYEKKNQPIKNS